jgi:hypothetical protein
MPNTAHRFHIELEGIDPPIWRRIRLPSSYSFWDLHVAIQDAMGWLDCHLHLFHVRNPETGELESIGIPDDEPYLDEPLCLPGWDVSIARYFVNEGDTASYEYDFGDDWRHTVVLEGVDPIREGDRPKPGSRANAQSAAWRSSSRTGRSCGFTGTRTCLATTTCSLPGSSAIRADIRASLPASLPGWWSRYEAQLDRDDA